MPVLERTMKTMRLADDVVTFSTFRKTMMDDLYTAEAELDRGEFTTQEEEIREAHAERERIKRTSRFPAA